MAAPIETSCCSFCRVKKRDLYLTVGSKRSSESEILLKLKSTLDYITVQGERICFTCEKLVNKFYDFKVNFNKFRASCSASPKTPHGPTPKRRRVIDQIVLSVEKLRVSEGDGDGQSEGRKTSRKKLSFSDHQYSKPDIHTAYTNTRPTVAEKLYASVSSCQVTNEDFRLLKNPQLMTTAKHLILMEIMASINTLSFNGRSVLFQKNADVLTNKDNLFKDIESELQNEVPYLYKILESLVGTTGSKTGTIAAIYGMIMQSRNKHASAIQRLLSTLLIKCHAGNKALARLNKLHITLSAESKGLLIKEYGSFNSEQVIKAVSDGSNGKLNGDNVDIFVKTNDVRMKNKNKDYHYFATDWTPFRLTDADFAENEKLKEMTGRETAHPEITVNMFLPNEAEFTLFKNNLTFLLAKIMFKNCTSFGWLDQVLPKHIPHGLTDIMLRKTTSYRLPILLKNEAKYDDCVEIMASYEKQLLEWYTKAGRVGEVETLKVPVGGDQLTRVRFDGAKSLRAGAHTATDRFDNLHPMVVEFFHTVMDFVEKLTKKFMKSKSGRDVGTLSYFKTRIQRSNVNGNVKSRFAAHEDFTLLVGRAYFLELAMDYFGMENLDSAPTKNIPEGMMNSHQKKRQTVFTAQFSQLADSVAGKCTFDQEEVQLSVNESVVTLPIVDGIVSINIQVGAVAYRIDVPGSSLNSNTPVIVQVPGIQAVKIKKVDADDLHNYAAQFLQWFCILLSIEDAIHEGNIELLNINLKLMIPCFYMHSSLSKYFVECIDYIMKTEALLSPKLAVQVRTSSVVNPQGRPGQNKAADMEKENQVKELKKLIKGLGANKTENAIMEISKAAPIINSIVDNLDIQIGYKNIKTRHKPRSDDEDLLAISNELRELRPFKSSPGRRLNMYTDVKNSIYKELFASRHTFQTAIMTVVNRLKRNFPLTEDEDIVTEDEDLVE